ncbi:polysaccharide deacetylase family protein [Clostridium sp. MSJ-11]|uniref:Polysaccharide deacetylase family protein n=1 Tax=Clostridium mobile TaxID=2841512 RepID=A0ABS6EN47_9CLOT|nr:polysaccharide deacetylase family protein [Clostridium mobile]MBU5485799.1 polysaccharide deacetylase family protein [Clostridium mobile]
MGRKRRKRKSRVLRRIGILTFLVMLFSISAWTGIKVFNHKNSTTALAVKEDDKSSTDKEDKSDKTKEETPKDDAKKEEDKKTDGGVDKGEGNKDKENDGKEKVPENKKIAYLTFDDGPSANVTPQILDILKENDVKATFFVLGYMVEQNPEILKRAKNEGHAIANHSYSHDYKKLYASTSNFLADIKKNEDTIRGVLGEYDSKVIRFPGGSFGRHDFINAVKDAGYVSVDWNALNGDAEAQNVPKDKLVARLKETALGQDKLYVLMHDAPAKETTVQALQEIIDYLRECGYEFGILE